MNALAVPTLRPGWRLQWEQAQGRHVLLYPEGMVQLNDSAGAILSLVDGERDVAALIDELTWRYPEAPSEELAQDVIEFFVDALQQGWIHHD
ncbi:pyrroloquinoline quinone biosynthesis peptide chaperone PqqD [Halomonas sp. LR3S48]|uniref:pyrroloquinoline quinone biosynthesis peptide chaperone PqqD n=1 Tax=Halomonas sp. LR3S48 TaxID=2982694 RepID=UPI0021E3B07F|nr:pyrroloquinoline quinone biosynthesis peptide chaperone PqqD [Halomonas sp. LR3S48]UYG02809.1 pyrroloquinoline quinone biosynthesis peptide chaperone PqqD [Halomonas sp. LR3S48]